MYIKDLEMFNIDLSQVILVDNNPDSYSHNPFNGFPIKSWEGNDPHDIELNKIQEILISLSTIEDDIREVIKFIKEKKRSVPSPKAALGEYTKDNILERIKRERELRSSNINVFSSISALDLDFYEEINTQKLQKV
eukprot:CAMPEP_0170533978 /NCGR_PEP_ID=MMETSP0209-20121228/87068_1 /TAXON_ID=665100 ORGANISM="Litonotus pictus, Strain P1" /NCGR_SAMPLE_ID=MMETSP0209 /ASSEMBLY_ACC=CAM_ASM_000301 /LENGTH=135 /DNA_ID=CAMNT_0010832579 /DNA_START=161 /DNA_END=564 /DNA_ORIENTATION=+